MTFLAGLLLARTIQADYGLPAKVKWPNDLLVDELKVAGMLSQMEAEGDTLGFVNIGIGVNVNNDPGSAAPMATSMAARLGRPVSRKALLGAFLGRLEKALAESLDETIIADWKRHTVTLGRQVEVATTRETLRGVAEDVDPHGGLRLRLADGTLTTVVHGDCFHSDLQTDPSQATDPIEGSF
jgi:BirA family biotin operon repressor/biotin-[acetyl-CoA-carboxylase] ligase